MRDNDDDNDEDDQNRRAAENEIVVAVPLQLQLINRGRNQQCSQRDNNRDAFELMISKQKVRLHSLFSQLQTKVCTTVFGFISANRCVEEGACVQYQTGKV